MTPLPKIAIVGAGALGCYYGAHLARSGCPVSFLMRSGLAEVKADGLRIRTPTETFSLCPVTAASTPEEIGPCDLVIVTLKTTANRELSRLITPLLHDETQILTLQNGLGSDETLAVLFGAQRIFGGLCFVCVNRPAPNEILCLEPGSISLGEFERPAGADVRALAEMFTRAGVRCQVGESLRELRWRKLVWNIPFNGLAIAAGGITTDLILADGALETQVRALMREVIEAAGKFGYTISPAFIDQQIEQTRTMGAYQPSSLVDYLARREVEVDSIWGEPLKRAQAAGAAMPRLETLHALLRELTVYAYRRE